MARTPRSRNVPARQRRSTCAVPSYRQKTKRAVMQNEMQLASEKKDWKHATCSVCLEHPHDAVLLLCSSHNEGCRPYMCGTNYRHSNCLEQFKKAYGKEKPTHDDVSSATVPSFSLSSHTWAASKPQAMELMCPLCRGDVKGFTVVEPARRYHNHKRRTCMHDGCSFVGSYKELCKHVNSKHPSSKPCEVDPARTDEWKKFESEREREDAISTVRTLNPRSMIVGDYVIEFNGSGDSDSEDIPLDGIINPLMSLDGSARGLRDFLRRVRRRHFERPRQNHSTNLAGNSAIQNDDSGCPFGVVQPIGRRLRGQVRSTHGR